MAKLKPISTKTKPLFGAAAAKTMGGKGRLPMKAQPKAKPAAEPRQMYGTKLGPDEQHLKGSVHFQQDPAPAQNPAQRLKAPKQDDGLGKSAASMSKRFIGG